MHLSAIPPCKFLVGQGSVSFDDLPDELVIEILSRLPVKTIVQSTCVCKRWYSIIKSPALVSAQLSHSISNPSNHYILASTSSPSVSRKVPTLYLISDDKSLSHRGNFKLPFETRFQTVFIVGSCHGLVCLIDGDYDEPCGLYGHDIYLINPSIQKYRKLSAELSCHANLFDEVRGNTMTGFGYSARQNDYKVVRIVNASGTDPWNKAEVYSLKRGYWKSVDGPDDFIPLWAKGVCVEGCLYWLPFEFIEPFDLICFDLDEEVFRTIPSPTTHDDCIVRMFQRNGSLVLYTTIAEHMWRDTGNAENMWRDSSRRWKREKLFLFVMEKDNKGQIQWKEFNYETENDEGYLNDAGGCSSSGRLICLQNCPQMIAAINLDDLSVVEKLWLDPKNDTFSAVENLSLESRDYGELNIDTNFIESLVLFLE